MHTHFCPLIFKATRPRNIVVPRPSPESLDVPTLRFVPCSSEACDSYHCSLTSLNAAMPIDNRSVGRDVHLYDARDGETILGGLEVNQGVTNANFYYMVEIFVLFNSDYFLRDEQANKVPRDGNSLRPGKYYIMTEGNPTWAWSAQNILLNIVSGSIAVTGECPLLRATSMSTGTRVRAFRDSVRDRDRRCLISGDAAQDRRGNWRGCDAAHIFPLAYEGHWHEHDYGRWISIPPSQGGLINSVQNGLLLRSDLHHLFDGYDISINPDVRIAIRAKLQADLQKDDYKVVVFNTDIRHVAGRRLDNQFRADPHRAVDQLLRWHFRQAVLANMKGAGVPSFEHDFPPGSDILHDIRHGPMASERMEFELFSRLNVHAMTWYVSVIWVRGLRAYKSPILKLDMYVWYLSTTRITRFKADDTYARTLTAKPMLATTHSSITSSSCIATSCLTLSP